MGPCNARTLVRLACAKFLLTRMDRTPPAPKHNPRLCVMRAVLPGIQACRTRILPAMVVRHDSGSEFFKFRKNVCSGDVSGLSCSPREWVVLSLNRSRNRPGAGQWRCEPRNRGTER